MGSAAPSACGWNGAGWSSEGWNSEGWNSRGQSAARQARGKRAQCQGLAAEGWVAARLAQEGWQIHGQRLRTAAGEVDIVAERDGLLTLVEVKSRGDLPSAAAAISPRQQQRLLLAGAILQGENPHWGARGMRFDAWFVAPGGQLLHVPDAFRDMG